MSTKHDEQRSQIHPYTLIFRDRTGDQYAFQITKRRENLLVNYHGIV